jgi:general secretion pathway protein L
LRDADSRIAAVRTPAAEAQALLARMDGSAGGGGTIFAERARLADPLRVLADLTDALPDDTFLSDFHLLGQRITISGQSAVATKLIGILASSQRFQDPSFASPVTTVGTDAGTHEQFSIEADVRGAP